MNMLDYQVILKMGMDVRNSAIDFIKSYLINANRNIIVGNKELSYIAWDDAFSSSAQTEIQVVPEIEITLITLDRGGNVTFIDAKGNDVHPSNLDTEELLYVVEYLNKLTASDEE